MRLSNKNILYNEIIKHLDNDEVITFPKPIKISGGRIKSVMKGKVHYYGVVSVVTKKDRRVNLRLFNMNELESIEKEILKMKQ